MYKGESKVLQYFAVPDAFADVMKETNHTELPLLQKW